MVMCSIWRTHATIVGRRIRWTKVTPRLLLPRHLLHQSHLWKQRLPSPLSTLLTRPICHLIPLTCHSPQKLLINLIPQKRTLHIRRLHQTSQLLPRHQLPQLLLCLSSRLRPPMKMHKRIHPLLTRKLTQFRQMITHSTHLLPQKHRNGTNTSLDIHTIPLQLLNAPCQKFMVVNQRPQKPPSLIMTQWLDPWILPRFRLPPTPGWFPQLRSRTRQLTQRIGTQPTLLRSLPSWFLLPHCLCQ
mmetsp:Transcript_24827/g.36121  ORF Transcript_24827/g.36121 Transcript_24827/m.36121 type:complete len:243 (-) Transcript_24827:1403-2131(-)